MKKVFNFDKFFSAKNLSFQGIDEKTGNPIVVGDDGKESNFNYKAFLEKHNLSDVDYEFNSPEKAVGESPVGIIDRLKLSFGNPSGKKKYLEKEFEGVNINDGQEFTVKKNGTWYKVDPNNISGDPWSVSEVVKDLADIAGEIPTLGGQIVGGTLGAAAGATAGATAGAAGGIPGVVAGTVYGGMAGGAAGGTAGAAAGSSVKHILGKWIGVDDGSMEEVAKDVGLDALLALGGEVTALGARPTLSMLGKATAKIKTTASESSIPFIAEFTKIFKGGGATTESEIAGMTRFPEAKAMMDSVMKQAPGDTAAQIKLLEQGQYDSIYKSLEALKSAKPKLLEKVADEWSADAANKGFSFPRAEVKQGIMTQVEQLGKLTKKGFEQLSDAELVAKLADESVSPEVKAILQTPEALELVPEFLKSINRSKLSINSNVAGKEGAREALSTSNRISEFFEDRIADARGPTKQGLIALKEFVNAPVTNIMEQNGGKELFTNFRAVYQKFQPIQNVLKNPYPTTQEMTQFLNQYVLPKGARNKTIQSVGQDTVRSLLTEAELETLDKIPLYTFGITTLPRFQTSMAKLGAVGYGGMAGNPLILGGAMLGSSPRMVGKGQEILFNKKAAATALETIRKLSSEERKVIMNQPELLGPLMKTVFDTLNWDKRAEGMSEQILQQADQMRQKK